MADNELAQDKAQGLNHALDQELVRRVQQGDSAAFDALVRKYQVRRSMPWCASTSIGSSD
jgi:hypothetical protein